MIINFDKLITMGCEHTDRSEIIYPNDVVRFNNQRLLGRCTAGEIWSTRLLQYKSNSDYLLNPSLLKEIKTGYPES